MIDPKTIQKKEFLYTNESELLTLLSDKFEDLINQVKMLYRANEEMFAFDPKDYDLIEARKENLEIINTKITKLKQLQEDIKKVCSFHPLATVNIYDQFLKEDAQKDPLINEEGEGEEEEINTKKKEETKEEEINTKTKEDKEKPVEEEEIKKETKKEEKKKEETEVTDLITELEI